MAYQPKTFGLMELVHSYLVQAERPTSMLARGKMNHDDGQANIPHLVHREAIDLIILYKPCTP